MGLRGIDVQVAIQRAADADKIQQAEIANTRAGEAGTREQAELARARRQEQPRQPEKTDTVVIQKRKEHEKKEGEGEEKQEAVEELGLEDEPDPIKDYVRKPQLKGSLDIKA